MRSAFLAGVAALLLCPSLSLAEVAKVTIASKATVANGQTFGTVGAYEALSGTIAFALDPADPHNAGIVDLAHAPRAADGKVHFTSDLFVLRPVDAARGNGVLFFEISNRGHKGMLGRFNRAPAANSDNPRAPEDFGDGFLMREGYTLVWVGWQFDIETPLVRLEAPAVDMRASPLPDRVTVTFVVDAPGPEATPKDLPRYLPSDPGDQGSTLTVRDRFWGRASVVARDRWRIVTTTGRPRVELTGGFEPGRVYDLTYRSPGARVAGVGLAAIRDAAAAFLHRHDLPVTGRSAYVFGASQSGRFLRQFLHDGFNVDEHDRRVFDLVWPHIAGAGLGSFNERFAMPGYMSFPVTMFPYTDLAERDADGRSDGIMAAYRSEQQPKVIYTNTPVEYWGQGRAAAMTHVTIDGRTDAAVPDNVRMYLLSGTQHGEAAFPPTEGAGQQLLNPTPQANVMRALLRAAHRWAADGTRPPASRYPRLSDGTLVPVAAFRFPAISGVEDARAAEGPGQMIAGRFAAIPFLVPQADADGNDVAGIRVPEVAVPLATTTGWNFRSPKVGNPSTIYALLGSYIPFAATRAERQARRDPRPSIEERYRGQDEYIVKIRAVAESLIKGGLLLQEDLENVLARARAHWEYATRPRTSTSR